MVGTLLAVVVVEIISNLVVERRLPTSASEPADYHMT